MPGKLSSQRRGWLKHGNRPGDFLKAPRCGAKNRRRTACGCPAMRNGRCRLHGGLSTGPKTAEGIEWIRRASTRHGFYSQAAKAERTAASARMLCETDPGSLVRASPGHEDWARAH